MKEFIDLIEAFEASVFNLNVTCGIIAGIVVLIFEIIFIRKRNKRDRRKETALRNGCVIKARRISMWDDGTTETSNNSYYHAKYQYDYAGKLYTYKYMGKKFPPNEISLYYKNNPHHVWSELERKNNPFIILLYLIPVAVTIIVINALGGV